MNNDKTDEEKRMADEEVDNYVSPWAKIYGSHRNREPKPKIPNFTTILREQLLKKKKFRRPDGTYMESTEMELIALKVIKELRTSIPVNTKLLSIIMDRTEGKPQESIKLDGGLELTNGIDAKDLLLQRLDQILSTSKGEGDDRVSES